MNLQLFDPMEPIPVLGFLPACKLACLSSGEYKGAAMWIVHFSMEMTGASAPTTCLFLKSKSMQSVKEGILTSYKQVVNQHVETYSTDEIIVEVDSDTVCFTYLTHMSLLQYKDALCMKKLRC